MGIGRVIGPRVLALRAWEVKAQDPDSKSNTLVVIVGCFGLPYRVRPTFHITRVHFGPYKSVLPLRWHLACFQIFPFHAVSLGIHIHNVRLRCRVIVLKQEQ